MHSIVSPTEPHIRKANGKPWGWMKESSPVRVDEEMVGRRGYCHSCLYNLCWHTLLLPFTPATNLITLQQRNRNITERTEQLLFSLSISWPATVNWEKCLSEFPLFNLTNSPKPKHTQFTMIKDRKAEKIHIWVAQTSEFFGIFV